MQKTIQTHLTRYQAEFEAQSPFPHLIIDDLWDREFLSEVRLEVENNQAWGGEKNFAGSVSKRWLDDYRLLPRSVRKLIDYMNSIAFIDQLEALTSIERLSPDPHLFGGGIHSIGENGFLGLHSDFNWHEKLRLWRRVNVLVYLNEGWREEYKGDLLLARAVDGSAPVVERRVPPAFNRTVIFRTDENSIHGHPERLRPPLGRRRNSIALYYYSLRASDQEFSSGQKRTNTIYHSSHL